MTKRQVDNYREGKLIPHCQLKAEYCGKGKEVSALKHQVVLEGAPHPHNVLVIDLPAAKGIPFLSLSTKRLCMHYYRSSTLEELN